ncbi:MAG: aminotransferase class I/II-fold pyridoxal phosphate-dependent enzyme [Candidatus Aenigmarchaeota archaeon]|nr:aminotransferase class I/II-fold pyridoxal phosphate-dependent enzyme [Candidatus Aenigmarchaeota archaeon]
MKNPEADAINMVLKAEAPTVFDLLSKQGKCAHYSKKDVFPQGDEARQTTLNATVGQAFTDDKTPMFLNSIMQQLPTLSPKDLLYAPVTGLNDLRIIWKTWIEKNNPSLKTPMTLPIVVGGMTHGLSVIKELFADEKNSIITPDKYWSNYKFIFDRPFDEFPCFAYGAFNVTGLKKKLMSHGTKKIVLLNFPNNPCGYTPTCAEAQKITDCMKQAAQRGKQIVVICDDAYGGLVYEDDIETESLFALLADVHERVVAIKLDGLTKEAYAWGIRVAFVTFAWKHMSRNAAQVIEEKTGAVIRRTISTSSSIGQAIAIRAMQNAAFEQERNVNFEILKSRYQTVKKILAQHKEYKPYFEPLPFNSGYFMCIAVKRGDAETIRKTLIQQYSTGVIAMKNLLRIAYSSASEKNLPQIFENIYQAAKKANMTN